MHARLADRGSGGSDNSFVGPRLMLQYRQRLSAARAWNSVAAPAVLARPARTAAAKTAAADGQLLRTQR